MFRWSSYTLWGRGAHPALAGLPFSLQISSGSARILQAWPQLAPLGRSPAPSRPGRWSRQFLGGCDARKRSLPPLELGLAHPLFPARCDGRHPLDPSPRPGPFARGRQTGSLRPTRPSRTCRAQPPETRFPCTPAHLRGILVALSAKPDRRIRPETRSLAAARAARSKRFRKTGTPLTHPHCRPCRVRSVGRLADPPGLPIPLSRAPAVPTVIRKLHGSRVRNTLTSLHERTFPDRVL